MLAMVAVGIWGAFLGRPLIYALPILFPLLMAVGAVLALAGVPFPPVETGIALSLILLGGAIALKARPKIGLAIAVVATFGLFHGYAHGAELPYAAGAGTYIAGFVTATGLLHGGGIALGLLHRSPVGTYALQAAGLGTALLGVWVMAG